MGCRPHGYIVCRYVYPYHLALVIDIGEMPARFLGVLVGHVKAYMVKTVYFHLLVYGTRHDITRRKRQALVVFLHERFARRQTQYAAVTAHSLGDEKCRMCLTGMIQCRGMELNELHIGHRSFA